MDNDDVRRAVQRANPVRYQELLDLEAQTEAHAKTPSAGDVTFVWTEAYGNEIVIGHAIGWADAKAECLRRSMTAGGWIAGEHRFSPERFIVIAGRHGADIVKSIVPWIRSLQLGSEMGQ